MNRILCLYLPSNPAGLRSLVQIHDAGTLSLKAAPAAGEPFSALLLACGHSGGSPRQKSELWNAGHVELYLAAPLGDPYIGTSLLSGEERREERVLYPWRQGVQLTGRLENVRLGQLPDSLSDALRRSGILNKAVLTELSGDPLEDLLERAAGSRIDPAWEDGPSFADGRSTPQARGAGRFTPALDQRHLQTYAQTHFRTLLENRGYAYVAPGPTASSAVYQRPDGQSVRAHFHASVGSAALIPLNRTERFWHENQPGLLGVMHDVHKNGNAFSGGKARLIPDWTIQEEELFPVKYSYTPGPPTATVILD